MLFKDLSAGYICAIDVFKRKQPTDISFESRNYILDKYPKAGEESYEARLGLIAGIITDVASTFTVPLGCYLIGRLNQRANRRRLDRGKA